ncbi:PEP-CTERM sorting domain-containing protein [Akkermansiaceae bacterium]|nr:PEP-CTERM sorting domain-containing protein [Akkermansiaceae bacterium]MDB4388058.1 PEP-CTERM sorting domain-containing protein [Akkermansiaceae bacterium]MDB4434303.1 PEP-CTERM sorting domain-containing protein [Akkermansiaceae bacterium]MDB4569890.1 PEP-CTERM sorting domain-containing protein [Akkermansiaceae bacterium]
MKKLITSLTSIGLASTASAALTLVTNGDFSSGGADWGFAGVGAAPTYEATGGNADGYAKIDQTAGGWGGVLINNNDTAVSLTSLNLIQGQSYEFSIDLINLGAGSPVAGMKIESWTAGAATDNSGDITFATTASWANYTFNYTVQAGADAIKFVPLLVAQPTGSSVGFDNVGVNVVPEPSSFSLLGLGLAGLLARRRR